jgi:hypothetical protein
MGNVQLFSDSVIQKVKPLKCQSNWSQSQYLNLQYSEYGVGLPNITLRPSIKQTVRGLALHDVHFSFACKSVYKTLTDVSSKKYRI